MQRSSLSDNFSGNVGVNVSCIKDLLSFFFLPYIISLCDVINHTFVRLFLFQNSLFFLRLLGVTELINQPVDQLLKSQKEDFKDADGERNNDPFDVSGKKRHLTLII